MQKIVSMAMSLPQVRINFDSDDADMRIVKDMFQKLEVLGSEFLSVPQENVCPKCGEQVKILKQTKWLFIHKQMVECERCGYRTENLDQYRQKSAERVMQTHGLAAAEFGERAIALVKRMAQSLASRNATLVCADISSLILKPGEAVILALPAIQLTERTVRHTTTRQTSDPTRAYLGGSFRVASGVYLHLGGSSGQRRASESVSASVSELFPKEYGTFIVTNTRSMFVGENMSATSLENTKLVSVSTVDLDDGRQAIMLSVSNRQKPVILVLQECAFQPAGVHWPLLHDRLGIKTSDIVARVKDLARSS